MENPSFEKGLDGWQHTLWGVFIDSTEHADEVSRKSLKLFSSVGTVARAWQEASPHFCGSGIRFTLSGMARADNAIPTTYHTDGKAPVFRLYAKIFADKSSPCTDVFYVDFAADTAAWQFGQTEFAIPQGKSAEKIEIGCEYGRNVGFAYFDEISLTAKRIQEEESYEKYAAEHH